MFAEMLQLMPVLEFAYFWGRQGWGVEVETDDYE